jgi:hypothetical protein
MNFQRVSLDGGGRLEVRLNVFTALLIDEKEVEIFNDIISDRS